MIPTHATAIKARVQIPRQSTTMTPDTRFPKIKTQHCTEAGSKTDARVPTTVTTEKQNTITSTTSTA